MELLWIGTLIISNITFITMLYIVYRQNNELEQKFNRFAKLSNTKMLKLYGWVKLINRDISNMVNNIKSTKESNEKNTIESKEMFKKLNECVDNIEQEIYYLKTKKTFVRKHLSSPLRPIAYNLTNAYPIGFEQIPLEEPISIDTIDFNHLKNYKKLKYN